MYGPPPIASRKFDEAFVVEQYGHSERQASKLLETDRSSYRYQPRADHNAGLREALIELAYTSFYVGATCGECKARASDLSC